jgi:hypothetical protein
MPPLIDPLLIVWEAMFLLAQVDADPDTPQVKKLVTDAELVLCRLTMELSKRMKHQYASQDSNIVPINQGSTRFR